MTKSTPKLVRIRRNKTGIIQDCDVYIGRDNNMGGWKLSRSKWHNPFVISKYGSVHTVCQLYLHYIVNSDLFHDIPELGGKIIGCWCRPPKNYHAGYYCHGQILQQLFRILKIHNFDTKMVQSVLKIIYPKTLNYNNNV